MAAPFENIVVYAGGVAYEGWESVQIEWTMWQTEINALVTTTEVGPWGPAPVFDKWNFPPGTPVEIYATGDLVFWGSVYAYMPKGDAESHSIGLHCKTMTTRNWTVSSVNHPTGTFENTTDDAIIETLAGLAAATGVRVMFQTSSGPRPIDWYQIRQGATNYQAGMDVLVRNGKTLMAHRDGSLVVTDGTPFKMSGALVQGENILRMSAKLVDEMFSQVEVIGQNAIQAAFDQGIGPHGAAAAATPTYRYRKVIDQNATTNEYAAKQAAWQLRRSAASSMQATIVAPGWRDLEGALWMANQDVYVNAPWLQIECVLRTFRVVMSQDLASGTTTELTLVEPASVLANEPALGTSVPYGGGGSAMGSPPCNSGIFWSTPEIGSVVSAATAVIPQVTGFPG